MSVTSQQTVSLLENVLFESATQAAANAGAWQSNAAATSVQSLAAAMAASGEEKIAATVVGYYLTALGRAPTAAEIRFYVGVAEQGLSASQIAAGHVASGTWDTIAGYFAHSPEFSTRGGLDFSLGAVGAMLEAVPWLYKSVLGRTPGNAEISYYDDQVVKGGDLGTLFREFTASPEFHADTDAQIAAALALYGADIASGQPAPATVGAGVLLGPPAPPAPAPTPTPAASYAFTTGIDTFTSFVGSGIDAHDYTATLGGPHPTLNDGDSLTGPLNTLVITDDSGPTAQDLMPNFNPTGLYRMTLNTTGNAGIDASHPFDVSSVGYMDAFFMTINSSGSQGDFISAYLYGPMTVNQLGASTTLYVAGSDDLTISSNSLTTLTLKNTNSGPVSLTDPTGPGALTIHVDSATVTSFTDASNHIASLTIAGSGGASIIDALSDTALTSLTLSGNVTLGTSSAPVALPSGMTAIDLSAQTGDAYITLNGAVGSAVQLGSGTNQVTDNHGGNVIDLGTGISTIDLGNFGTSRVVASPDANYAAAPTTPNVVIKHAGAGTLIQFADPVIQLANPSLSGNPFQDIENYLVAVNLSQPTVGYANDGTNTYIVESASGHNFGPTDTVLVEVLGVHTINLSSGMVVLTS